MRRRERTRFASLAFAVLCLMMQLGPKRAQAQLNVEALATTVKEPGHHGLVSTSLSIEKGNVELITVRGSGAYVYTNLHPKAPEDARKGFWFRDRFLANGGAGISGTRLRDDEARIANDGFMHVRYTRMQWLKVGGETFFQVQYDAFRLLTRRVLGGGGSRFVLARTDNFALWYGTGYMIEEERRNIDPADQPPRGPDPVRMVNHRWNNYLTWLALQDTDRGSIANTVYVQPRFDDPADIQIFDELSINASLGELFTLTLGLTFRYDSRAPRSVERYDIKLTNALTAQF